MVLAHVMPRTNNGLRPLFRSLRLAGLNIKSEPGPVTSLGQIIEEKCACAAYTMGVQKVHYDNGEIRD